MPVSASLMTNPSLLASKMARYAEFSSVWSSGRDDMLAGKSTPPRRPHRPLLWKFRGARLFLPPGFASDDFEPARAVGVLDESPAPLGADHAEAFLVEAERGAVIVGLGEDQVQRTCQT